MVDIPGPTLQSCASTSWEIRGKVEVVKDRMHKEASKMAGRYFLPSFPLEVPIWEWRARRLSKITTRRQNVKCLTFKLAQAYQTVQAL